MKLTDYVIRFIADLGVTRVFLISGGAAVHLVDSISKLPEIDYVCNNHEQACAMAADGYSRVSGNIGVAISTSGPGATNLLTGVCGAYYDSIPLLAITGQVTTWRLKGDSGVRQVGFQETDTTNIYKSVTKYSRMLKDPYDIKYELQKAVWIAKHGRPGPVLLDLPDDLQRMDIDVFKLRSFTPPLEDTPEIDLTECIKLLSEAERPAVVLGWGMALSKAEEKTREFVEKLNFPVLQTWAVASTFPFYHPLHAGYFGQHGTKCGNLVVQNADLLLVLGSRLDTHMTGSKLEDFAPNAKKIIVDIDNKEIQRLGHDIGIASDISYFIDGISKHNFTTKDITAWRKKVSLWKMQYPTCLPLYYEDREVNPYVFFQKLSSCVEPNAIILTDTGSALAWFMQAFQFDRQRLFSDFNNTAMGWALPAAIGAHFASGEKIIAIMGDGALQMNIQELSTVKLRGVPVKIFVINNKGYSMIRQTQDDWLQSKYEASTYRTIGCPDFTKIATAYGIRTVDITNSNDTIYGILETLRGNDPVLCNVHIPDKYRISPVVKFGERLA